MRGAFLRHGVSPLWTRLHNVELNRLSSFWGTLHIDEIFSLEKAIREASEEFLHVSDYRKFVVKQLILTESALGNAEHSKVKIPVKLARIQEDIEQFVDRTKRILKVSAPIDLNDGFTNRVVVALTSYLRAQIIFYDDNRVSNRLGFANFDLMRLPYMLMGTHILLRIANSNVIGDVTFQTVGRIFSEFQDILFLLSHANSEMVWNPHHEKDSPKTENHDMRSQYLKVFRALSLQKQRKSPRTLGAILEEYSIFDGIYHSEFIMSVAQVVNYKIVPLSDFTGSKSSPDGL